MRTPLHNFFCKIILVMLTLSFAAAFNASAQLIGGTTYTIDNTASTIWPANNTFASFGSAITALNGTTANTITSEIVFNVVAGETFSEPQRVITYLNPHSNGAYIKFQRTGPSATADPILLGTSAGTAAVPTCVLEIFKGDNYIFDGIDFNGGGVLTAGAGTALSGCTYGVVLLGSTNDGCQFNTFQNCTISNVTNTTSISASTSVPNGSNATTFMGRGVYLFSQATQASGENSNNSFFNNTINNCLTGYHFQAISASFPDANNQVSTNTNVSSNVSTITNILVGGSNGVTGLLPPSGMRIEFQSNFTANANTIDNSATINSVGFVAIYSPQNGTTSSATISNNTIKSITNTGNGGVATAGIDITSASLTTANAPASVNIYGNTMSGTITSSTNTSANLICGIIAQCGAGTIHNNVISGKIAGTNGGTTLGIGEGNPNASTDVANYDIYNNSIGNVIGTSFSIGLAATSTSSSASASRNIYGNTVNHVSNTAGSSGAFGIYYAGTDASTGTIHDNVVTSVSVISNGAGAGKAAGIGAAGTASVVYKIYNNFISGIYADGTSASNYVAGIVYPQTPTTAGARIVQNNTIINLRSSGVPMYGIVASTPGNNQAGGIIMIISGNTVRGFREDTTGFTPSATLLVQARTIGIWCGAPTSTTTGFQIFNNDVGDFFSSSVAFTIGSGAYMEGISFNSCVAQGSLIYGNHIHNLSIPNATLASTGGAANCFTVRGLYVGGTNSGNDNTNRIGVQIYKNIIDTIINSSYGVSSNGAQANIPTSSSTNPDQNGDYSMAIGMTVNISTCKIYNNMIDNIRADNATSAASTTQTGLIGNWPGVCGMELGVTISQTLPFTCSITDSIYDNTIYLPGVSNATVNAHQSACLFYTGTPATSAFLFQGNIFYNNYTENGTGSFGTAIFRQDALIGNTYYSPNCGNNLVYANPGLSTNKYLFYQYNNGGTPVSYATRGAYTGAFNFGTGPIEQNVVSADPLFVNDGSVSGAYYDAHLKTTGCGTASGSAWKAGVTISTTSPTFNITDDVDGNTRPTTPAPDLGADQAASGPGLAGPVIGQSVVCASQTQVVYSVVAINGATSYTWALPTGASPHTGTNVTSTNSITVDYSDFAGGNITVQGINSCGNGGVSPALAVSTVTVGAAGTITGASTVCQGQNGVIYSVPLITNATAYSWTVPSGYTIISASTNNSILVDFSSSAATGNINVTGTNATGCANGTTSANFSVTVSPLPGAPLITPTSVCPGSSPVFTATVANMLTSNAYSWTTPAGTTITGSTNNILLTTGTGANTSQITSNFSSLSPSTYSVSVTGINGCGAGPGGTQAVVVINPTAPVATAGTSATSSQITANWSSVGGATGYFLDVATDNGFNNFVSGYNNLGVGNVLTEPVTGLASGTTYYYRVRATNGTCTSDNSNTITYATIAGACPFVGGIVTTPFVIICSGNTTTLTVTSSTGNKYQWQISSNNTAWSDINGATNTTYTTASGDGTGNKFYRLLSKSTTCWDVASTTAEVDVSNPTIAVTATSITDNTLILNWSPVGSGNYNITYSGTSSGFLTGITPPKTVTGLTADGTYSMVVTQTGVSGCSATGTLNVNTLCAVPTNLTATPSTIAQTQQLTVSWSGPAGNYRVYYRPLYSYITFFTQDVTNATTTVLKKQGSNNLYASNTYQVYVSRLDCPNAGNVGQPTGSIYVTTNPTTVAGCASPVIDTVFSTCPVELEVQLHGGSGIYNVYIQRLTPTLQQVNSYGITGGDFVINAAAGQQYLISADSKCGSVVSTLNIWHNTLTVKPTCTSPANLVLSNPTCHGFTASWNADQCISNTVSGYDLYMRQVGSINYNSYGVALSVAPVGPHELVNWLGAGKNMQVFVQSVYSCGGAVTYGPSSQTVTITTQSAGCRDEEPTDQLQENKPSVQQYSANNDEVFSLYPNPNTGEFTVDLSRLSNNTDEVRIEVLNMIGQTVITQITSISDGHMSEFINLPNGTAAGTYIVRLTAGKNVYTAKVNISR